MELVLLFQGLALLWTAFSAVFRVTHARKRPVHNAFRYNVRMAVVDLDDSPRWWQQQARYHMTAAQAREFAGTKGKVEILTDPISAGYVLNPISVYYCYSDAGQLETCIAEVTNTPWAERVTFAFNPEGEQVPKTLHVSPLMDMKSSWRLRASQPGDSLQLTVAVSHPELGHFFYAGLHAKRAARSSLTNEEAGLATLWRYGFQPQRVAVLIYWQAVKLLWKGVSFYGPPSKEQRKALANKACTQAGKCFVWRDAQQFPWYLSTGSSDSNDAGQAPAT
ncbi:hypothetical protein WJX72_010648 [[Myrmecia] bisecta]|uniref:DUF1365 domain-containing protein n=1 Tax=[Myrmecia] bisecta TaxID=41462 RepID=A0AAW1PTY6_9CHLO